MPVFGLAIAMAILTAILALFVLKRIRQAYIAGREATVGAIPVPA